MSVGVRTCVRICLRPRMCSCLPASAGVFTSVCVHECVCVRLRPRVYSCLPTTAHVFVSARVCGCVHVCLHPWVRSRLFASAHVFASVCICACVCVHPHPCPHVCSRPRVCLHRLHPRVCSRPSANLKISKIFPIYKEKGSIFESSNYRHVSLLLQLYLWTSIWLSASTFNKSCFSLTEAIRNALDENYDAVCMFADQQKAFDSVDHEILLSKLNYCGIRGVANDWFRTYISNRKQFVAINGIDSEEASMQFGRPQYNFEYLNGQYWGNYYFWSI